VPRMAGRLALVGAVFLGSAFVAVSALADDGGREQVKYTVADQAAARATVLRRTDLQAVPKSDPWVGGRVKPDPRSIRCANYKPKVSDLVITGSAASHWTHALQEFVSQVDVLATVRMLGLEWQRSTSRAPGLSSCLRDWVVKGAPPRTKLRSFAKIELPQTGPCVAAFRAVVDIGNKTTGVRRWVLELIAACRGRAFINLHAFAPASEEKQVLIAASRAFKGDAQPSAHLTQVACRLRKEVHNYINGGVAGGERKRRGKPSGASSGRPRSRLSPYHGLVGWRRLGLRC
jgi:hypothetical protein